MSTIFTGFHVWLILHSKTFRKVEHSLCLKKHGTTGLDREHAMKLKKV